MRLVQRGIQKLQRDILKSISFSALNYLFKDLNYMLLTIEPFDSYCYKKSVEQLNDRQNLESELVGILTVAYGFRGEGLYRSIQPQQEGQELATLARRVSDTNPQTVVEIGTAEGGTLYTWCRFLHSAEIICSIDIGKRFGQRTKFFREFTDEADLLFINSSSQDRQTAKTVDDSISEGIDFLFIDGDHSYEGVKQDFELYSPLVNNDGIIAFHDIVKIDSEYMGVPRFWKEVKDNYESEEIILPKEKHRGGIGILHM